MPHTQCKGLNQQRDGRGVGELVFNGNRVSIYECEISPGCSLEGLKLKLKLQYFGHLMWRVDSLEKTDAGRDWGQEEKGTTEDEMAGWYHGLDGRESEWTPGDGDGQGGLACCDSWGRKESDMTEQLYWSELNWTFPHGDLLRRLTSVTFFKQITQRLIS